MKIFIIKYFVAVLLAINFIPVVHAQSISINATDFRQTIDLMGGDMERSANAIQNAQNKEEIVDWAFNDIALNTCRIQFDKNQELVEGVKNWDFYAKQLATMQLIKTVNPNIRFFACLRTDYDGYGDENNLPDWICNYKMKAIDSDKLGVFLADYVEYMNNQGLPITYLSLVKEWSTFLTADKAQYVILKLNSELSARGVAKPLIIDQGFWSLSQGITYMNRVKALGTKDLYDGFCTHNYSKQDASVWASFMSTANSLQKAVYNDETNAGAGGPTYGAEPEFTVPLSAYVERCISYQAGLKGEIFFEIWSRGINKETRAIYYPSGGTGKRLRGYYMMKHFANQVADSKYITSATSTMPDVYTMSFRLNNQIVLWVINNSLTPYNSIPVNIQNETIDGSVNKLYWTVDTPITGSDETLPAQASTFSAKLDAQSLNCFIFKVGTSTSNKIELKNRKINQNCPIVFPSLIKDGMVNISDAFQNSVIRIVDLNGKIAKRINANKTNIDVSELNPGIYLVHIETPENRMAQKIIII